LFSNESSHWALDKSIVMGEFYALTHHVRSGDG